MKKKIVIIGAGNRVRDTIIPALVCLHDGFEITAIVGRRTREIKITKSGKTLFVRDTLAGIDFRKTDLVIIAVTLSEVPKILWRLPAGLTVMVDTPVLAFYHFWALPLFLKFKKVSVSEEFPSLPPLSAAKAIIAAGLIGRIQKIEFLNFGYEYHALAAAKFLATQTPLAVFHKNIYFTGGANFVYIRPQDYQNGRFRIIGDKGSISNFDKASDFVIRPQIKNGLYSCLEINGKRQSPTELDKKYLSAISECLFEKNLMKSLKIRAFMELLINPVPYGPIRGCLDQLFMLVSAHFSLPF